MRREEFYIRDIIKAADHIHSIVGGLDFETFSRTVVVYSATLYQLIIIGEAAGHLSLDLHERYPHIPWSDVIGFRHIAVHGYFATDLKVTWDAATLDVPLLREQMTSILNTEFGVQGEH